MSNKIPQNIRRFLEERDWIDLNNPANTAKSISIEAAELLECFQWSEPTAAEIKDDPPKREKIGKELADVLIYTYSLIDMLGLDADTLVEKKLEHASKKYPPSLVKGKLGQPEYQRIKREYRDKGLN